MESDPVQVSGMLDGASRISFENARKLREKMTEPERIVWEYLRLKPYGFKFNELNGFSPSGVGGKNE